MTARSREGREARNSGKVLPASRAAARDAESALVRWAGVGRRGVGRSVDDEAGVLWGGAGGERWVGAKGERDWGEERGEERG